MGRQASAWRYTGRGGLGHGNQSCRQKNNREKEMRFATQEQMSNGYYGTYSSVKETLINEVQKKYKHGCDMAHAIRKGKKLILAPKHRFVALAMKQTRR